MTAEAQQLPESLPLINDGKGPEAGGASRALDEAAAELRLIADTSLSRGLDWVDGVRYAATLLCATADRYQNDTHQEDQ